MVSAGPILTAYVGVSQQRAEALQAAGEAIPNAVRVQALVDTGASCTCVDYSILSALDLSPTGSVPVHSPTTGATPETKDQYDASLLIPGAHATHVPLILQTIPVVAAELVAVQGFEVLIGRDILQDCVLVYNGTNGWFTLAF
ncbi:MAG: aspartyl protease family protein [Gemmatimonadota bacterium]